MLRCPFVGCPGGVDTSGQSTVRRFWMAGNHTLLLQKERRRVVNGAWEERADMLTARRECGQTRLRSEMSHKLLHHPRPPMSWKPRRAPRYAVCGHVIFAPLNKLVVLASLCSNGNSQNFDSYLILSSALLTLSSRRCPEVCRTKIHSSLQPRLVTEEAVECAPDTPTCSSSSVCLLSAARWNLPRRALTSPPLPPKQRGCQPSGRPGLLVDRVPRPRLWRPSTGLCSGSMSLLRLNWREGGTRSPRSGPARAVGALDGARGLLEQRDLCTHACPQNAFGMDSLPSLPRCRYQLLLFLST